MTTAGKYRIVLILILLVSAVLRFYQYQAIPFAHDEFSALFRTKFDSLSDLVLYGVKLGDTHPAGVQVFMYYWIKLFSATEWVVKLPFTLAGIASIVLIYKIAKSWFNITSALIIVAFFSTLQYTVMYSQIARPYGSGIFLCTAMVYFWSLLLDDSRKRTWFNAIYYILFSAASAYNHHFSLLFAAIVGVTGVFFIPKKRMLMYAVSGVLIFALYIPHLEIFFHQLGQGGIEGWLKKPTSSFFIEYLFYTHNYSYWSVLVTVLMISVGIYYRKESKPKSKYLIITLVFSLLPFLTGFFYSVFFNAVLRYSVLLFSFPFVLFLLFGHIKQLSPRITLVLVALILASNSYSLIFERQHYQVYYDCRYERIVLDALEAEKNNENVISIIASEKNITEYYFEKYGRPKSFIWFDSFETPKDFVSFLKNQKEEQEIYLGFLSDNPPTLFAQVNEFYPTILWQRNYHAATSYMFSKHGSNKEIKGIVESQGFENELSNEWTNVDVKNVQPGKGAKNQFYQITSDIEWTPNYSCQLKKVISNENNFIDISVDVKSTQNLKDVVLVATLTSNEENIHWSGAPVIHYKEKDSTWFTAFHSIKLSDIDLPVEDVKLDLYVWNKGSKEFLLDNYKIKIREGNPKVYGLFEKF